jgi:hypothetical protein
MNVDWTLALGTTGTLLATAALYLAFRADGYLSRIAKAIEQMRD